MENIQVITVPQNHKTNFHLRKTLICVVGQGLTIKMKKV